jgi:hypothetical protein
MSEPRDAGAPIWHIDGSSGRRRRQPKPEIIMVDRANPSTRKTVARIGIAALAACTMLALPAGASERYPASASYVNQYGQIVSVGAPVRPQPLVQTVRVLAPVRVVQPVYRPVAPVIVQRTTPVSRAQAPAITVASPVGLRGTLGRSSGGINVDRDTWPSGRKCCRPGQPYFNEEPDS